MIHFKSIQTRILTLIESLVIVIILSISVINFFTVRKTLIRDIREEQLLSFVEASQSDIQMVIENAIETSTMLAEDPTLQKWFVEGETDKDIGILAKKKLDLMVSSGYFTVFAVNKVTKNYWSNGDKLLDVLSTSDPDDSWFFDFIKMGKKIVLNFDYNQELNQTLFFFNALMGPANNPLGAAGVGINPDNLIKELTKRKITPNSKLWIIDQTGIIQISDTKEEINKNISTFLPTNIVSRITNQSDKSVISDILWNDNKYEFAKMKIGTTDFLILVAAPTSELIELLNPIRVNTIVLGIIFSIITLILVLF